MLVVGLFDGLASGAAYALAGVPHAALWAAITGALAIVPFLGYVAVAALTLQLAMAGATKSAVVSLVMGCIILVCGDKIVRPAIAGSGVRLRFVWVLIGCLGGFETLGLVGLVDRPRRTGAHERVVEATCSRCRRLRHTRSSFTKAGPKAHESLTTWLLQDDTLHLRECGFFSTDGAPL